ncbi:MAG TPA: ribonuclease T2 [Edaphobacter sp.]|jgi:ribonuclease T2|nr:ribonuclease T2 [Edaphobacter sp.]
MKRLILLPACFLFLWLTACDSSTSSTSDDSQPETFSQARTATSPFDYYLLNLSWSPEYCHSHPTDIQCAQHSTFVLHGLWPENKDGTYPENCTNAPGPADPSQYKDIYPDAGLLQHEWKTHGTCSGLAPDAFFNLARSTFYFITVPPELAHLDKQTSMPPAKILELFTAANPTFTSDKIALSCGNNYLTAIEACVDKQGHPTACGKLSSCRAQSVRIPPPQ